MGNTQNKTKQNNKNFVAKGVINLDLMLREHLSSLIKNKFSTGKSRNSKFSILLD